jgi:hypothetical protein
MNISQLKYFLRAPMEKKNEDVKDVFRNGLETNVTKCPEHDVKVLPVDELYALLGYYAASSGNPLPAFRDNISVQSSTAKKSKENP